MKPTSKTKEIEGFLASQIVDEGQYEKLWPIHHCLQDYLIRWCV